MKAFVKIFFMLIALLMLVTIKNDVGFCAENSIAEFFTGGIPSDWLTYEGNATKIISTEGSVCMIADTLDNKASASVRFATPIIHVTDKLYFSFSFRVSAEGDDNFAPDRYLRIINSDTVSGGFSASVNLINIKANTLRVNTTEIAGVTIEDNRKYQITAVLDSVNKVITLWLDGMKLTNEPIAIGEFGVVDYTKTRLMFTNQYSSNTAKSEFELYSFSATTEEALTITSPQIVEGRFVGIDLDEFTLHFGMMIFSEPTILVKKTDYSSEDYVPIQVEVKFCGTAALVKLQNEIREMEKYRIVVGNIKDQDGNIFDDLLITAESLPSDYKPPTVLLVSDTETVLQNGMVHLSVMAESTYCRIVKVEIYINDIPVYTSTLAPFEYDWKAEKEGEYSLYAKAYDEYDIAAVSNNITISVIPREPATININHLSEDGLISLDELKNLEVSVFYNHADIECVQVYLDELVVDKKTEAPYIFSIIPEYLGTHQLKIVVETADGLEYRKNTVITVVKREEYFVSGTDFENYSGGTSFGTGFYSAINAGYLESVERDDGYGKCLLVGINDSSVSSTGPILRSSISKNLHELLRFSFDFYASNSADINYFITVLGSGGNNVTLGHYKNGKYTVLGQTIDCSSGQWHTCNYEINWIKKTITFSIDNKIYIQNAATSIGDSIALTGELRLSPYFPNGDGEYFMFDNYQVFKIVINPYVIGYENAMGEDTIHYMDESITIQLSSALGDKINKEDFSLRNEIGEVEIESILVDNTNITIKPKYGFESSNDYELCIKSTALLEDNITKIGMDTKSIFKTSPKAIDVVSGDFLKNGERVSFKTNLVNDTDLNTTVKVILVTFKNEVFSGLKIVDAIIPAYGSVEVTTPYLDCATNTVAKAFVIEDFINKKPLSNKIYKLENEW